MTGAPTPPHPFGNFDHEDLEECERPDHVARQHAHFKVDLSVGHRLNAAAMDFPNRRHYILVIDDDAEFGIMVAKYLKSRGYRPVETTTLADARLVVGDQVPDALLISIDGPGNESLEYLRDLRSADRTRTVPILALSADRHNENSARAMLYGANGIVPKPIDTELLAAKLEVHLHYHDVLCQLERRNELLARLAAFDELTQLYNRRSLMQALPVEIERSVMHGHSMAVLLIDADHFKLVNDEHGHLGGDEALQSIARRLERALRKVDILARYGGEEFCAILPGVQYKEAQVAAERLRSAVSSKPLSLQDGTKISLTVSIGLAWLPAGMNASAKRLIKRADGALYRAKQAGRNIVISHDMGSEKGSESDAGRQGKLPPTPNPTPSPA